MKFKEYVEGLTVALEDNPEYADLDVITSSDDEGNNYNRVHFTSSVGEYDGEDFMQENEENDRVVEVNAVCVN